MTASDEELYDRNPPGLKKFVQRAKQFKRQSGKCWDCHRDMVLVVGRLGPDNRATWKRLDIEAKGRGCMVTPLMCFKCERDK